MLSYTVSSEVNPMYIADKKLLAREYFAQASMKKSQIEEMKKHDEKRARAFHESDKVTANRMKMMDEHAKEKDLRFNAREKEIDQHMAFLKHTTALNII